MIRQVTLTRASRRADKSISITFVTQLEESTEAFMEVDKLISANGIIYFKEGDKLTQEEIDEIDKVAPEIKTTGKSLSKQLRGVLFIEHLQNGGDKNDFQDRYSEVMNKAIQKVKDRLL